MEEPERFVQLDHLDGELSVVDPIARADDVDRLLRGNKLGYIPVRKKCSPPKTLLSKQVAEFCLSIPRAI
jgi:hypothetical protein